MGDVSLNISLWEADCTPLSTCWQADFTIRYCCGGYLINDRPDIIDQLKRRYATPGTIVTDTDFGTLTDQTGKILTVQLDCDTAAQSLTFTTPAQTIEDIYNQMKAKFKNCDIAIIDGQIQISRIGGPKASIVIGGDSDLIWKPFIVGTGYLIENRFYCGHQRIRVKPPHGEKLTDLHVDVPPGQYKIWARTCFGMGNEETNTVMTIVDCNCCQPLCVFLLLPIMKTCSDGVMFPLMDHIVQAGANFMQDDADKIKVWRGLMWGANIGKQEVLTRIAEIKADINYDDYPDLYDRIVAMETLAALLPECY